MKIEIRVHPTATTAHECAQVELHLSGQRNPYVLDLDVTALLRRSHQIDEQAFDFLFVASIIYAIDKAVPRTGWPHRHPGGDCQRRALAQFTRCGVHHRPRHHRGRWIHRTIARQ
jgi:hypothetical protein